MKISNIQSKGHLTPTFFPALALMLGLSASIPGYAAEAMNITGARVEPLTIYALPKKSTASKSFIEAKCRYPLPVAKKQKGWLYVEQGDCKGWVRKFQAITDIRHKVVAIGGCTKRVTGGIGGVRGMDEGCKDK